MTRYPFLSDEWIEQTRMIRDEYADRSPELTVSIRMNQIVHDVPFGDGILHAHVDTSSGRLEVGTGHLPDPDLTITLAYDTARAILVDGDAAAAMNAFLGGRIRVDGDITKLIALQSSATGVVGDEQEAAEALERIKAVTV
jgi:hypothetical protein